MSPLASSFLETGIHLLTAAAAGFLAVRALHPPGRGRTAERIGWGIALGLSAIAASAYLATATGIEPRFWFPALLLAGIMLGYFFRTREGAPVPPEDSPARLRPLYALLVAAIAAGVVLYAARALIRPMWSIDFLAIWGLKGRSIFSSGGVPAWLSDSRLAGWSHPEYPLGLPLLYAGTAALLRTWDDHAMALLFPAFQIATLAVLYGWLRRRGTGRGIALCATALLALFEPLYSGFLTGMADVPLALTMLLLGVSLSDALDRTDRRAMARLALASVLASSVKNEGLFLAAVAAALALLSRTETDGGRRRRVALAAILPALLLTAATRASRGSPPLRDFDFGLLAPSRLGEFLSRAAETISVDLNIAGRAWIILPAIAVLLISGLAAPWAGRLLWLAAAALAVYLALPAFAVLGPQWLAETTLFRTSAALAPLAAAGIAGRLASRDAAAER